MSDERLAAALKRAAEIVARLSYRGSILDKEAEAYLTGWAEAIRALATHLPHPKYTLRCLACEAIAKFVKAMLGGDDG